MVDILDKQFPKGECKERGRALVMLSYIEMMLQGVEFEDGEPSASTSIKASTPKSEWTRHYRNDKGVWEDTCIHGIGHEQGVHGCDGCCAGLYTKKKKNEK